MFDKLLNKTKKDGAVAPTAQTGASSSTPAPQPTQVVKPDHNTAGTASLSKADEFLEIVKGRRSIYALGNEKILSDKQVIKLIQSAVREAPSSFNAQSSRIVILLGDEHDKYWENIVLPDLKKVLDEGSYERNQGRVAGFKAAYGTVLFFEDQKIIENFQENIPAYASMFPTWSTHSTGMAQVYTWNILLAAGYGANLQHYGGVTQASLQQKYSLPETWKLHAELVFGSPNGPAGEKTYIPDEERFKTYGATN